MTAHVRSYLRQQVFDVFFFIVVFNTSVQVVPKFNEWYWQWGSTIFLMLMLILLGIEGLLTLWRPQPDPTDFDWQQRRHWLYLLNEPNGDYQQMNLTWSKVVIVAAALGALSLQLGRVSLWHEQVGLGVAGLTTGIYLMNIGLWGYRLRQRTQISGRK